MASFGTIYPLTVEFGNLSVPYLPMMSKDLSIRVSTGASRLLMKQMLEFAVQHNIKPLTEHFPLQLDGIKQAKAKMEKGELRYKAVLIQP